ncbi:hypothetical protein B0O99DRAFT_596760 [Bisporella sp. PMI_857]|nr:hypothetical protein B0O99DRAFT_596760 [Bisporella sp. PMI_857]
MANNSKNYQSCLLPADFSKNGTITLAVREDKKGLVGFQVAIDDSQCPVKDSGFDAGIKYIRTFDSKYIEASEDRNGFSVTNRGSDRAESLQPTVPNDFVVLVSLLVVILAVVLLCCILLCWKLCSGRKKEKKASNEH